VLSAARPFIGSNRYEEKVDRALSGAIRSGDCVWDVGANVGIYTERFAAAVGAQGRVVAFEPIGTTYVQLVARVSGLPNVQTNNVALGAVQGTLRISVDADPTSPTNSLAQTTELAGIGTQDVRIEAGDDMIASSKAPAPNVLKIDTEGFEEEVFWGLRKTLTSPLLFAVLVEVHFALLEARGLRRAPERISSFLKDAGFQLTWVDASHLMATRSRR
jgi:FkbM family methyltransferase